MHARRLLFNEGAEALPASVTAVLTLDGLMVCPVPVVTTAWMPGVGVYSELYRVAFEEATAMVRALRFERRNRIFPN